MKGTEEGMQRALMSNIIERKVCRMTGERHKTLDKFKAATDR
jgi:hypothetical protein